jgi:flagellar biosynthesis/type III secretory pathway chaperone
LHDFLAHIRREESAMDSLLESLREVRSALLKNDLNVLPAALAHQAEAAQACETVRLRRGELLQQTEAPTLTQLGASLGEEADQSLRRLRQRIAQTSREVEQLNRANAAMVHQAIDLTRQVLAALTQTDGGDRYQASGQREPPVTTPLIEMDG